MALQEKKKRLTIDGMLNRGEFLASYVGLGSQKEG